MNITKPLHLFLLIALSTAIMPINAGESYNNAKERREQRRNEQCHKIKVLAALVAIAAGVKMTVEGFIENHPVNYKYSISGMRCDDFPTWLNHIKDNNLVECAPGIDCLDDQDDESGIFCMKVPGDKIRSIFKISRQSGDTYFKYRPIECSDLPTIVCYDTNKCFKNSAEWTYDWQTETEYSILCLQDPTNAEGTIARVDRSTAAFFTATNDDTNEKD